MKETLSKVMIVDDEIHLLVLISSVLEDSPCEITTAQSGEEGMQILKNSNEFAVTVSNFHMGKGMNGGEFLKLVKLHSPNTVRILMTAGKDKDSLLVGVDKGEFDSFAMKPIVVDNFIGQVESSIKQNNILITF